MRGSELYLLGIVGVFAALAFALVMGLTGH